MPAAALPETYGLQDVLRTRRTEGATLAQLAEIVSTASGKAYTRQAMSYWFKREEHRARRVTTKLQRKMSAIVKSGGVSAARAADFVDGLAEVARVALALAEDPEFPPRERTRALHLATQAAVYGTSLAPTITASLEVG